MGRKTTSVSLPEELLDWTREHHIKLSSFLAEKLEEAKKEHDKQAGVVLDGIEGIGGRGK